MNAVPFALVLRTIDQEAIRANLVEEAIANDQHITAREQGGRLCDRSLFEHLSDLELACLYQGGPSHLHDAAYCELHLRHLTPWKIQSCPPQELSA